MKQARSYLKSIFDEAIEQEFLVKDPTRKLKIPKNLRPKDKQILTWEQLRAVSGRSTHSETASLLMLDMTDALRPSELFAIRWRSFDDENTLSITETVYRRKIRPFGKTPGSLTKVHLPDGLPPSSGSGSWSVRTFLWEQPVQDEPIRNPHRTTFMFPNADGGFLDPANFRYRVLKPLRGGVGTSQAELPGAPADDRYQSTETGVSEGCSIAPAALTSGYHRKRVHAGAS